jgi:hypothetical protein
MKDMKFLKVIIISFSIVFFSVLIFGIMASSDWEVERSIVINAKPEKIYPFIVNFESGWSQWNTFNFDDQNLIFSYSGPAEGVGATRTWHSEKVGEGYQTITHADPEHGIAFELMIKKTKFKLNGTITFEPMTEGTKVTIRDYGNVGSNPFTKYKAFTMDRWLGADFERSLAMLKEKVEADGMPSTSNQTGIRLTY